MTPSSDLKSRVLEAAKRQPSPTRAEWRRRSVLVVAGAFAVSFVAFLLVHGVRAGGMNDGRYLERPIGLVLQTSLGAAALASAIAGFVMIRGRSMLGRPAGWLIGICLAAPAVLFSWKVIASLAFEDMMVEWPERIGLKCMALSVLFSLAPLLAFCWTRQNSAPTHPALTGASLGIAAGGFGWVLVDLWCPVAFVPHLLVGHVLPMILLAGLGALLGWALLRVQAR